MSAIAGPGSHLFSGHWAVEGGLLYTAWLLDGKVRLDSLYPPCGDDFEQYGSIWFKLTSVKTLDALFAVQTVCEWNGGLWDVSGVYEGIALLDFFEGSFPFYLMQNRPGVQHGPHYGHLVGKAPMGELANIRSWSYRYDLETREPVDKESMPQLSELVNEFAATHPQSE